jgi:glycosyltransferase involved in cell wall biosynthesis
MGSPFFSVIVPLFNKQKFVGRAIDSILRQSFDDFEVIVVDDGSIDESCSVVEAIQDPRVYLVKQKNQGGAGGLARNTAMSLSKGEWLVFLDADDAWFKDHLSEIKKIIEEFPSARIVSTTCHEVREGADIQSLDQGRSNIKLVDYFDIASIHVGVINSSSVAIHQFVYEDLGGFISAPSGPDLEYWARIALKYPLAISTKATAVYFRENGGNMEMISKQDVKKPLPSSLNDISPSVAMLSSKLDDICSDPSQYVSVMRYINSRITNAMRGALIKGEVKRVKALKKLYFAPCTHESKKWWYLSSLPEIIIASISLGRNIAKRAYSSFKR